MEQEKLKWGEKTQMVLKVISEGGKTLGAIAKATNFPYRNVNGIVDALERQQRVTALDYRVKRGQQVFRILNQEEPETQAFPEATITGPLAILFGSVPPHLFPIPSHLNHCRVHRIS